ncbi:hypothetical protein [Pseudomonas sp. MWU16-30322]|uniref:hypothetical protein n=1 Tax=Pseudomonas sp. MWU16-30322 TaxID=2878092 RepID=UPI001CFC2316|nr:hypothetical protein [Pseudomonas sp. MWU16-30322]
MDTLTQAAEGTMTANIKNQPTFTANPPIDVRRTEQHWRIEAHHKPGTGNRSLYFLVPLSLPDNGDERVYALSTSDNPDHALVYYFGQDYFIPSSSGTLSIRYNADSQQMLATFDFKGQFLGFELDVSDGQFDLKDIDPTVVNTAQLFTADLAGVAPSKFLADTVNVTKNEDHIVMDADQIAWEIDPPRLQQVRLSIGHGISKGKHHFGKSDDPVRASYTTSGGTDPGIYHATAGTLTLTENPSTDRLLGELTFEGEYGDKVVTLTEGIIDYTKA